MAGWLELGVMLMDDTSHSHDVAVRMRKTCMNLGCFASFSVAVAGSLVVKIGGCCLAGTPGC